ASRIARPASMPPRWEIAMAETVTSAAIAGTRMCESPQSIAAVAIAKGSAPANAITHSRRWTHAGPFARMSVGLGTRGLDELRVLVRLGLDVGGELLRRAADGLRTQLHHRL